MDVDQIVAALTPADREALLERLLAEAEGRGEEDLDLRVRRLEEMVGGAPGPWVRRGRRYRPGTAPSGGPECCHHHHGHCPHCGW